MKTQALEEIKLSPSCMHNNSSADGAHRQKLVSTEKTRSSNVHKVRSTGLWGRDEYRKYQVRLKRRTQMPTRP